MEKNKKSLEIENINLRWRKIESIRLRVEEGIYIKVQNLYFHECVVCIGFLSSECILGQFYTPIKIIAIISLNFIGRMKNLE